MSGAYDDIIGLSRPASPGRKRMSNLQRAAQFSPFAALSGYDAAIQETARLTDQPVELAEDGAAMLDEKLRRLARRIDERPTVTVTCFRPDSRKSGGAYVDLTGRLKGLEPQRSVLLLEDGRSVELCRILDIREESGT